MKNTTTIEEFVENYIENKKRANSPDSYSDWIISNGVNSEKLYSEAIRDISGDYNRAKSEYGTRAEKLSSLGLSASGYSDYLSGKAYSEMQKRKEGARSAYSENERKNISGYRQYLKEKSDEAARLYDSVVSEITASKIIDYDEAYEYAKKAGLDGDAAASAAKKASDAAHKSLRDEVINTIIVRNFEDSQAREYALAMGLSELEAEELGEYAFKINQAVHYSEDYLKYLEEKRQNNKK